MHYSMDDHGIQQELEAVEQVEKELQKRQEIMESEGGRKYD